MTSLFSKKIFCLDLNCSVSYKEKKNLIDLITHNGGYVSFILNKKCSYLLKTDRVTTDSYKCRQAFKLSIPVLHVDYIYHSINETVISLKKYLIENSQNQVNFKQGKVTKGNKMIFFLY